MTTISTHGIPGGSHRVVSGNKLEVSPHTLRQSEVLDLLYVAQTDAARSLAVAILPLIEAAEARKRPRGPKEYIKVLAAMGAVLGGVLVPGLTKARMVHRAMGAAAFDGLIGYRSAKFVLDGLAQTGLLTRYPGIHFVHQVDGAGDMSSGMVTRYAATAALYALADTHHVTPTTVGRAFIRVFPTQPPKVVHLLTLKAIDDRRGWASVRGGGGGVAIPIRTNNPKASALRAEVRLANGAFDRSSWTGCQPPRAYRAFRENWTLGGRWVVAGSQTIQTMSPEARLEITMNGEPVAECDARASHLTILAGLAGVIQLTPDPYSLPGYSRHAVKQAVLITIGNGRLPTRWSRRSLEDHPELGAVDIKPLTAALAVAYPFLRDPGAVLDVAASRVALKLQAVEAAVLTRALVPLWQERVPGVPLHDGILCPDDQTERVCQALKAAYSSGANGAIVGVTVARATQPHQALYGV